MPIEGVVGVRMHAAVITAKTTTIGVLVFMAPPI
jgi:polysaccharide pyruvyl transferase WcaK-like protein